MDSSTDESVEVRGPAPAGSPPIGLGGLLIAGGMVPVCDQQTLFGWPAECSFASVSRRTSNLKLFSVFHLDGLAA